MTWIDQFKKNVIDSFLQVGLIGVLVSPKADGVKLPEKYGQAGQVLLHLGRNLPTPIPDLEVGDEGIRATLSFDQTPFGVWLPWTCVLAAGLAGSEMFCQFQGRPDQPEPAPEPDKRGPFSVVDGGKN